MRWFWTPERLTKLRNLLDGIAEEDAEGFYIGATSISDHIVFHGKEVGLSGVSYSQAGHGVAVLVFLGILELGRPGVKRPGYKRRYYPKAVGAITQDHVNEYRQQRSH